MEHPTSSPFVRTVLGDIAPEEMGLTYSHEHIIIEESYPTLANPLFLLNDVDKASEELQCFYEAGGRAMVDTMPADCGRNVLKLAEVSRRTGVNIIVSTHSPRDILLTQPLALYVYRRAVDPIIHR